MTAVEDGNRDKAIFHPSSGDLTRPIQKSDSGRFTDREGVVAIAALVLFLSDADLDVILTGRLGADTVGLFVVGLLGV
ncbi:hypothetical protein [Paraburkholderia atlantica]|uniref:hypothetical protein n=1 Tax=Paraburkholderia atlantica TaxID=2654982 RepID=UPI0012FF2EBA|nr:hypothetical protein [Paraburkholderia atlantica]MBB5510755.1 hypothetical protein [Paraburkholderia atlantica]